MLTSNLYFIVGPLRTGSSLMSRCLDDHPESICLCESEINRALFRDYFVMLHFNRMRQHGLPPRDIMQLLNARKQDTVESLFDWYRQSQNTIADLYGKPILRAFGDKSPDFFTSPRLVAYLADNFRLIYTVRDPRAIFRSIVSQEQPSEQVKKERWANFTRNFIAWEPYLDNPNVLSVRYEDLIADPAETMANVYMHLGLQESERFLEPFERMFPRRFLWDTAIDWESGIRRDFDLSRIDRWLSELTASDIAEIKRDQNVTRFMNRYGYE